MEKYRDINKVYESDTLHELHMNKCFNPFFHLTYSKEERELLRLLGLTIKRKYCYGVEYVTLRDKKTNETMDIVIYREV